MNVLNNHNQNIRVQNLAYDQSTAATYSGSNDIFYKGNAIETGADIIVRKINARNYEDRENSIRAIINTTDLWNHKISYVLKIWTCVEEFQENDIFIAYEPYQHSLKEYLNNNIKTKDEQAKENEKERTKEKQEELKSLLKDIIELVRLLHSRKIVLKNITLDDFRICKEDDNLKAKIVNPNDMERITDEDGNQKYKLDIINIGKLFFSIVTFNLNYEKLLRELNRHATYKIKHKYICDLLENYNYIETFRKKLFAHLIINLIEVENCNHTTIIQFTKHPFFWDENGIERFLRIINSRIDNNDKQKDTKLTKKRILELNEEVKYENWTKDIHDSMHIFIQKPYDKISLKCNDLIKFIRNKIAHNDDDTDNEDITGENSAQQSSSSNSSTKKIKQEKDLAGLWLLFNNHGGPLNYFMEKFPSLLYDLYIFFRKYSRHKKCRQFYPKCFSVELPKPSKHDDNCAFHPATNMQVKNNMLKNNEAKELKIKESINSKKK